MEIIQSKEILVSKAQNGDTEAFEELIKNYRYYDYFKKKYNIPGYDQEDILQEVRIGVMKAVRGYNPERGASFETYAYMCVERRLILLLSKFTRGKKVIPPEKIFWGWDKEYSDNYVDNSTPETLYFDKISEKELEIKILEKLSKIERIVYSYIRDSYSYREISQITGLTLKSADNTVQRVKRKIIDLKKIKIVHYKIEIDS